MCNEYDPSPIQMALFQALQKKSILNQGYLRDAAHYFLKTVNEKPESGLKNEKWYIAGLPLALAQMLP